MGSDKKLGFAKPNFLHGAYLPQPVHFWLEFFFLQPQEQLLGHLQQL